MNKECKCVVNNLISTHSNNSFAKAEGTPTAILRLILRLVVAQCVVLQSHPTVLPAMDVVCPLKNKSTFINVFVC